MRFLKKLGILALSLGVTMIVPVAGFSFDISNPLFHSGITTRGHSGLLFTRAGTSIARGAYFVGISPDYFDRDLAGGASEQKLTVPVHITYGLPYNIEINGNVSYVSVKNGSSESDLSDLGISVKWSFLQEEGMSFPSLAAGLSGRLALGDINKGTSDIDDYAITFFLAGTALIDLGPGTDYAFSLYGEAAAVFNDPGADTDEKHGRYSAGILLPVPALGDFAFILELGGTINKGRMSEADVINITPAVRFNYKRGSFTIGASVINPEIPGEDTYIDYIVSAVFGF